MAKFSVPALLALTTLVTISADQVSEKTVFSKETTITASKVEARALSTDSGYERPRSGMYGNSSVRQRQKYPSHYSPERKMPNGLNCELGVEFIYMRAAMDDYVYTETGYVNPDTLPATLDGTMTKSTVEPSKGIAYSPPITYKPGFRVSFGAMVNHTGWDISADYLWFYSSDGRSATATYKQPFQDLQSAPTLGKFIGQYPGGFFPTKHNFKWDQRYQMASIEFGRDYFVNRHLKLRPSVGVKGTWQKKTLTLDYFSVEELNVTLGSSTPYQTPPFRLRIRDVSSQWGAGPFAGLDSSWYLTDHFSIYGGFSLAEFFFNQKASNKLDLSYIGIDPNGLSNPVNYNSLYPLTNANLVNVENDISTLKPMLQCALGFQAESYFSDSRYHVLFQIGWEAQYWPNQVLLLRPSSSTTTHTFYAADFSIQGGTVKLRLDF